MSCRRILFWRQGKRDYRGDGCGVFSLQVVEIVQLLNFGGGKSNNANGTRWAPLPVFLDHL